MKENDGKPDTDRSGTRDPNLTLTLAAGRVGADRELSELPELDGTPLSVRERITLRGLHSSGGIGEVWRAYDKIIGREIALKRLQSDQRVSEANRARFYREAQITAQLEHPGIVPVYDFNRGDPEGSAHCFYTMRFVRGQTLREVIAAFHFEREAQRAPLLGAAFFQLLGHFTSICKTMAFAHSRRIIHRDLKGDNVIVGAFGEVLVLDWGLAKRLDDDPDEAADPAPTPAPTPAPDPAIATMQGQKLGTPAYMAPEQALGLIDRIDHRTDVYGLAAILYELLTGRPPFLGADLDSVLDQVVRAPPIPPRELVADVPRELEQICLVGLSKDMDARQASVAELGDAVEAWMNNLAERKRVEQERERFFDLSTDLLAIIDRAGVLGQTNAAWRTLLGWEPGDEDPTLYTLVLDEDRERARAELGALWTGAADQASVELRMRCADGGYRFIDWSARVLPDDVGLYLVGRDVTARRQSEQEVEGLLESAPDAMCVIDSSGTIVRVNAQLERLLGYPRAALLGQPVERLIPARFHERHRGHVARFVACPETRPMGSGMQLIGRHADGGDVPVEVSLSPVQTETRLLISCTLRDIRERQRAARTIAAVLEAAPDAMITIDRHRTIQLVNRQTLELFGYTREELVGAPIERLVPVELRAAHAGHVERFFADPSPRSMGAGQILHGRYKDGSEFAINISLSPVQTDDGPIVACAIRRV